MKQKPKVLKKARADEIDYKKAVVYFKQLEEAGHDIEQLSKIDDDDPLDKQCQTSLPVDDLDLTCLQLAQTVSQNKEKITEKLKNTKEKSRTNLCDVCLYKDMENTPPAVYYSAEADAFICDDCFDKIRNKFGSQFLKIDEIRRRHLEKSPITNPSKIAN